MPRDDSALFALSEKADSLFEKPRDSGFVAKPKYQSAICGPEFRLGPPKGMKKDLRSAEIISQIDSMLQNFRRDAVKRQERRAKYPRMQREFQDGKTISLFINSGFEFFNPGKINSVCRNGILQTLAAYLEKKELNSQIFIDANARDFTAADSRGEADFLSAYKNLNLNIIFNFGTSDEFLREVFLNSDCTNAEMRTAAKICGKYSIVPNAFLRADFHSLAQTEIIESFRESIRFLRRADIAPVVMLPEIRRGTLQHFLYGQNLYNPIDPKSAAEMIEPIARMQKSRHDEWQVGFIRAFSESAVDIFKNPGNACCKACSQKIMRAFTNLKTLRNAAAFREKISETKKCRCQEKYLRVMKRENAIARQSLSDRIGKNLKFAIESKKKL
jgi:uncharacterized Fe-S cluster-containing MiaB family protein